MKQIVDEFMKKYENDIVAMKQNETLKKCSKEGAEPELISSVINTFQSFDTTLDNLLHPMNPIS